MFNCIKRLFRTKPTLTPEQLQQARLMVWAGIAGLKPKDGQTTISIEHDRSNEPEQSDR